MNVLSHWGQHIMQTSLSYAFTWKNTFIFSVKFDPRYPIVESVGIGSGSDLVPEMQQATTWISENRYPDTIGPFY